MKPTPRGYVEPVKRLKPCKPCKGTGQVANNEPGLAGPPMTCPKCLGFGEVKV